MREYSIVDLLIDTYYAPTSLSRRFNGGIIDFAEKREDTYPEHGTEHYAVRYTPTGSKFSQWATVSVRIDNY